MLVKGFALSLLGLAAAAFAQVSKICASSSEVCIGVNIPNNSQDTYFQITAPENSGWAGVGIGDQMTGSLIFVIYPSTQSGQVTVSPRIATGHIMPRYDSDIKIKMLDGSGISDGTMVANFVCSNCRKWDSGSLDVTSTNQPFIWAIGGPRNAVKSAQPNANINEHSSKNVYSQGLNLVQATGGNGGQNVFSTGTSTNGTETGTGTGSGSGSGNGNGSGTVIIDKSSASDSTGLYPKTTSEKIIFAHGLIMGITWVILFPLGASFIRLLAPYLPNPFIMHRALQNLNFILVVIALGLGVWYSNRGNTHYLHFHQYFGTIIVALLLVQISLGILHHRGFVKYQRRTPASYAHIWFGRLLIVCAIINGGLGLNLIHARSKWVVLYSVVAAVVMVAYAVGYGLYVFKRGNTKNVKT